MKKASRQFVAGALPRITKKVSAGLLPLFLALLGLQSSEAGSATWNLNPVDGEWYNDANWTPNTAPDGSTETATFDVSNTSLVLADVLHSDIGNIVFSPSASAYTLVDNFYLEISGAGITNNSALTQNVLVQAPSNSGNTAELKFRGTATAGTSTAFAVQGYARLTFLDNSTADHATFTFASAGDGVFLGNATADHGTFLATGARAPTGNAGLLDFSAASTAANATITIEGGVGGPAALIFEGSSSAGSATCVADPYSSGLDGGVIYFAQSSTADNATLIANGGTFQEGPGGTIYFEQDSTGGTASVEMTDGGDARFLGTLDVSVHNLPGVTIGSLEGSNGLVFVGANELGVGSNNRRTTFSGVIQDGGYGGGTGGSLTKVGKSTLTLTGANTYTGTTTISRGTLLLNNVSGSGTGSGQVQVIGGTLGGVGTIAGPVIVGTGGGAKGFLSPGASARTPGTLTIQNKLFLNPSATYSYGVKSSNATADKVVANGVRINNGAKFSLVGIGTGSIAPGTVITVIDNTAATPIKGTFSNLADGSTLTDNNNTYQADYQGGSGNDLTLTVIP